MEELLIELLRHLECIGEHHEELYDSEVREQMRAVVSNGFLKQVPGYEVPDSFGMFSKEGDQLVKLALENYIAAANQKAAEQGVTNFNNRLAVFQNENACTPNGSYYDDFFGWSSPEQPNDSGRPTN